jgi:heme-degrading monooxygenase HmoA
MFARTLELTIKVEKKPELIKKTKNEILPILHKQVGFVEILALENEVEMNKCIVLSFWHTRVDAERYERDTFPKIKQLLEPFVVAPPIVKTFNVEETVSEKFTQTMAA